MKRIALGAGLVGCLFGWSVLFAEEKKPPTAPAVPVAQLIDQLSSPEFAVREKAYQALAALGPAALDNLKKAQSHEDPEVRRRIGQLIPALEAAIVLAPKRVTLRLKQQPIRDAVVELAKQTGYQVELYREDRSLGERIGAAVFGGNGNMKGANQRHDLNLENVTFWQAFEQICAKGGLVARENYDNSGKITLAFEENRPPFVYQDGLFRVTARGFDYSRNLQFGTVARDAPGIGQLTEYLSFSFAVTVEPRVRLLGIGRGRVTAATDNLDRSMVPVPAEGWEDDSERHSYGYNRGLTQQGQLNLLYPSPESRRMKHMKGVIPVIILVKQVPLIVIEDPLNVKGKTVKADDTELALREVKKQGDRNYQVHIAISRTNGDAVSAGAWWHSLQERIVLQDANGNKYQSGGGGWSGNQNSVDGNFHYYGSGTKLGPPAKLVYYSWVTHRHYVPFEFKDLPLP